MSLGAPANLIASSGNVETTPPPPPADPSAVLAAIQSCSSHESSVRRPAEEQLQQWENAYSGRTLHPTGYLTTLISIVDRSHNVDENRRLLAAILLKNGIPKAFSVPLSDEARDSGEERQLRQERAHVRSRLPALLFQEGNTTCALHLQLALSNIALFEFPNNWPTLLEDLVGVAAGGEQTFVVRIRAIKTLRLCLQSIRHRRIVVQKPSAKKGAVGANGNPMLNMRNLGNLIGKAVHERKEMHARACSIFGALAEGIVNHAQTAIVGGGGGIDGSSDVYSAWQAESLLVVGYTKCMTELSPMVEIEDSSADPRTPAVRKLLESLAQICEAVKTYPATSAPPALASIPSILQEYTMKMDKVYRASLLCCISWMRSLPQLFAPQVAHALPAVVEPIFSLDATVLQSMPVKRLMNMTGFVRMVLMCPMYDERRKDSMSKNAVLSVLMGGRSSVSSDTDSSHNNLNADHGVIEARSTVTALLAEGTIQRLVEALVGKFLRLHPEELQEWEDDPEGRFETDLAEKVLLEADGISPRHCGGALLLTLMGRETDRVARTLLELTQRVYQQLPPDDVNGMLSRESCYRALELCHSAMVGGGQRRLDFSEWFRTELRPMLSRMDLGERTPVAMRAMQARAVQVVQAYSTSLRADEFAVAFESIARLMTAPDLVTAFCAARCVNQLALLHVRGTEESPQLLHVREHSVLALGNAFALANRSESEECLRVVLMCVSGLVEVNGLYLEPVLQAIAEQLPGLWERARDSVPIHSCLLSVLNHLIMKMGYSTVENSHVQTVLFPLLDYCTDITVVNRAETLLEDGLRLWLVTLVSSRLATMGPSLNNMLPRLEAILRSGLEPHLSLKVLQFNAILLGPQVVEPLAAVLREMLVNLTSCIHSGETDNGDTTMDDEGRSATGTDRGLTTTRNAVAALNFADGLMQMFPDLGLSICSPAVSKVMAALPGKATAAPLLEASFHSFGRLLWTNPNSLDEIFANDPNPDEKIMSIVKTWISVVTSISMVVMLSPQAQKIMFIDQKGTALSLCSAVCRSPRVARVAGRSIIEFTRKLLEVESRSKLDLDALVEATSGTTRKVVGDGPLGDSAARTAEVLKTDPLLTVSLKEAWENAGKAMASV
eukprot:CAMPEP_0172578112 /NCGR_PEP_ID=MMETSP1067-20121228/138571_1 /TAXON_ID=265564 ORGANISM="Thalassiosira punctigera, Strain Tpunct2005C2" /NCGR_SAMPLE_ID=MMETSP1067 /ASSEMBLY_ACC=CAM_ASM_000444 /LENGTH=1122 /DNA_ID=CAMNT_0013370805 /DNA_START=226 /DNA_END=3594 /DNA_ORIENTATION=+